MIGANDGAKKWSERTAGATQAFVDGVGRVTQSPGAAAAAKSDLWQARVASAAAKEKFARRAGAVDVGTWKQATQKKSDRLASGAQEALPKYQRFASSFYPHVDAGRQALPAKTGTLEGGIARSTAMIRHNATYKG